MKRSIRICIEIFAPPLIGAIVFALAFIRDERDLPVIPTLFMLTVFSYLYAILPSLVYMAIMEIAFSRGLSPKSWRAVSLSAILGTAAGIAIVTIMNASTVTARELTTMSSIGLIAGFVLGFVIRRYSIANTKTA